MPSSDQTIVQGVLEGIASQFRESGLEPMKETSLAFNEKGYPVLSCLNGQLYLFGALHKDHVATSYLHLHLHAALYSADENQILDSIEACVAGVGATLPEMQRQAAQVWVEMVGAPLLSLIAGRSLLHADHFEGSEVWGVPHRHGFVGPAMVRGQDAPPEGMALLPFFSFDDFPRDGQLHLVKTTLIGSSGRWTRHLEIDGHRQKSIDENYALGIAAPDATQILTRYAVFFDPFGQTAE